MANAPSAKSARESPALKANFLSILFFSWLFPLIKKGYKKELEVADLYNITEDKSSSHLCEIIEKEWKKEKTKEKRGKKPSYHLAIMRCFKWRIIACAVLTVLKDLSRIAQPLLLAPILGYFKQSDVGDGAISPLQAYLYALGLALTAAAIPVLHHPVIFINFVTGMKMRIASCAILYRKALRLNQKSLAGTTTGHIVNLMSNDVARLEFAALQIQYLWWGPVQAVVILAILWVQLGPSSLAGYTLVLILTPLQALLGKAYARLRTKTAVQSDERIRLMDQVIAGMKVIKMYCWEQPFSKLIASVRAREMRVIAIASRIRLLTSELGSFSFSKIATAVCILVYVLTHDRMLPLELLLVLMRLLVTVQDNLAYNFSKGVSYWSEMAATCARIQKFLQLEEIDFQESQLACKREDAKVELCGFSGKWEGGSGGLVLSEVTLQATESELIAIVGPVGSGKSSLLMAMLGELSPTSGSAVTTGCVAYASQQPWIFSTSLRDNILFGSDFDADRYNAAIEACALRKDIESLAQGDETLVGERGVILSGGQRARVSLARAVYQDADVYLLDDPLSAVDAAVAKHLFDRCINGLLKDRVRVLVTHQLHFVQAAARVHVLVQGVLKASSPYNDLVSSGIDFTELLKQDRSAIVKPPSEMQHKAGPPLYQSRNRSLSTSAAEAAKCSASPGVFRGHGMCKSMGKLTANGFSAHSVGGNHESQSHTERDHVNLSCTFIPNGAIENTEPSVDEPLLSPAEESKETVSASPAVTGTEQTKRGAIAMSTYLMYFRSGGNYCILAAVAFLLAAGQASFMVLDWYATSWAYEEDTYQRALSHYEGQGLLKISGFPAATEFESPTLSNRSSKPDGDDSAYSSEARIFRTYIFGALIVGLIFVSCTRTVAFYQVCLNSSKKIHNLMFSTMVRSPMRFFDTNPVGRILNRFSKDIGTVDDQLPIHFMDFFTETMMVTGTLIMAMIANPWSIVPLVPIVLALYFVQRLYIANSRAVKRLEGIARSPVYSHISSTLTGIHTVRAFKAQAAFVAEFDTYQDGHTEAFYMHLCLARWLAIRLDWMCAAFISAVIFSCLIARESLSLHPSLFGLTTNYVIALTGSFQFVVRHITTIENLMTSVERIAEYTKLDSEAPLVTSVRPPSGWPQSGCIDADCVSMRYSNGDPLVLKNVCFRVKGTEKIGICGRTGAGKSSLLAMLFRLCEPSGRLLIDGVSISDIGLHDLRSKLSIIPQDPVLFSTTIRLNLDPFGEHSDAELWSVLQQVQLAAAVRELPGGLESPIYEGGANFSVGQRQLVCLARAMLRHNRILVVDEATANVDPRTDAAIQETVREKFKECTVLTIAHRIDTIMDCDRVMVLDDGTVREFGVPHVLLQHPGSLFSSLAQHSGKDVGHLCAMANASHTERIASS